jgi:hypothetical protein
MLMLVLASACGRVELEPQPVKPAALEQASQTAPPETPAAPSVAPDSAKVAVAETPIAPGSSKRALRDTLPICAFSSVLEREKAPHLANVKKQKLRANSAVVFGVFPPGCLNDACDARPNLQCWIDREGDTIVVNSRFSSIHKDGSSCTTECREVDSSCETEALAPGKYTVRHGDKSYKLQIPSVLRDPCFNRE